MDILHGDIGSDIRLSDFKNKESILINSPGGNLFEGLAIYDYVVGANIEVGVIGICASAATLPLIASAKSWGTPNSRYLIHNPWNMTIGDADEMQKEAESLKNEQERALSLYEKHLNGTREELQALMNEEKIIDANEALRIGLIKEVREYSENSIELKGDTVKNLFNEFKMYYKMKDDNEMKKELSGIKLVLDKISKLLSPPKLIIVQDVNGVEIDFGDAIETKEQISVGVKASIDGSPANGDYVLSDGSTYVFESGTLAEIKEPASENSIDVDQLQNENAELKADNEKLMLDIKNSLDEKEKLIKTQESLKSELSELDTKFNDFKNKYSEDKPEINPPEVEDKKQKRVSFNIKFKN